MFQKLKMTYLATAHVDPKMLALLKGYLFWIPQSMQIQNNVDRKFYVFLNMHALGYPKSGQVLCYHF
jgi:hypothetical protein